MAANRYYTEDELVQKVQSSEYGWLNFVNHHSPEWQEEYEEFCRSRNLIVSNGSAEQFVDHKGKQLEVEHPHPGVRQTVRHIGFVRYEEPWWTDEDS